MRRGKQITPKIQVLPIEIRVVLRLSGLARSGLRWLLKARVIACFSKRVQNHLARNVERKRLIRLEILNDVGQALAELDSRCSLFSPTPSDKAE